MCAHRCRCMQWICDIVVLHWVLSVCPMLASWQHWVLWFIGMTILMLFGIGVRAVQSKLWRQNGDYKLVASEDVFRSLVSFCSCEMDYKWTDASLFCTCQATLNAPDVDSCNWWSWRLSVRLCKNGWTDWGLVWCEDFWGGGQDALYLMGVVTPAVRGRQDRLTDWITMLFALETKNSLY